MRSPSLIAADRTQTTVQFQSFTETFLVTSTRTKDLSFLHQGERREGPLFYVCSQAFDYLWKMEGNRGLEGADCVTKS